MVTRTRLRAVLSALGLYTVAALIIGYFGLSAYTGAHGLKAKQDLAQQQTGLMADIERTRAERLELERKVSLLRADNLDPDMLDERARAMLDYLHPRDLTLMLKKYPRRFASRAFAARRNPEIAQNLGAVRAFPCARFRACPISANG